jgi:hypothetical protein
LPFHDIIILIQKNELIFEKIFCQFDSSTTLFNYLRQSSIALKDPNVF